MWLKLGKDTIFGRKTIFGVFDDLRIEEKRVVDLVVMKTVVFIPMILHHGVQLIINHIRNSNYVKFTNNLIILLLQFWKLAYLVDFSIDRFFKI